MNQHFLTCKLPSFYAHELNVTGHHLNVVAKDVAGKTASEVIRARCILEAKRLLIHTDRTVSEIAYYLNYSDSSYFAKAFKAETSWSPVTFRRRMSEKYRIE